MSILIPDTSDKSYIYFKIYETYFKLNPLDSFELYSWKRPASPYWFRRKPTLRVCKTYNTVSYRYTIDKKCVLMTRLIYYAHNQNFYDIHNKDRSNDVSHISNDMKDNQIANLRNILVKSCQKSKVVRIPTGSGFRCPNLRKPTIAGLTYGSWWVPSYENSTFCCV